MRLGLKASKDSREPLGQRELQEQPEQTAQMVRQAQRVLLGRLGLQELREPLVQLAPRAWREQTVNPY